MVARAVGRRDSTGLRVEGDAALIDEVRRLVQRRGGVAVDETALDDHPEMLVETRRHGEAVLISRANQHLRSRLGFVEDELLGRSLDVLYTPRSRALLEQGGYERALAGRFLAEERELVAKDGTVVPVLLYAVPLREGDEIVGTRATFVEISAQRRVRDLMHDHSNETAVVVGEVAHELNNALTIAMTGLASLLASRQTTKTAVATLTTVKGALDRAAAAGQRLLPHSAHTPPAGFSMPSSVDFKPTGRVLVVDDEPEIRRMLRRLLLRRGYSVTIAPDAQSALDELDKAATFDLLVSDVVMPGMTGIDLWASIAEARRPRSVLFISGFLDQPVVRQHLGTTDAAFLQKPFGLEEFLDTVDRLVGARATQSARR